MTTTAVTGEQKLLAILAHLSYLLAGLGFLLAPLVLFLWRKEDFFVAEHAKQALVAHITLLVVSAVISFSCFLLVGILLLPAVGLLWLIFFVASLRGAWRSLQGKPYHYPLIQGLINQL